ncbi:arginine deiminase-related protein [Endozoicomonas gorgoniicola]|nr:arginine deiminase-related protein [Endozoicomonas gorgoniicola]
MKQIYLFGLFTLSAMFLQPGYPADQLTSYVVMVPPNHFAADSQTFATAVIRKTKPEGSTNMQKKALQEYTAVKQQLHSHHVHVIELPAYRAPDTPDSVFPNNWFVSLPAPCPENIQCGSTGNTLITLFPMLANQRKKKSRITALQKALSQQAISSQYNDEVLKSMTANQSLDGGSSMVLDRDKKIIFAALSPRTNQTLLQEFADRQGYKLLAFRTVFYDQPVYHTRMMLSIGDGFAVLCSECISEQQHRQQVWQALSDKTVIDITADQTRQFAGNLLQLKNDQDKAIIVLSRTAFQSLNDEQLRVLNSFSDQFLVFDIPTIETYGGGSAGCMLAEIFLQPTLSSNH